MKIDPISPLLFPHSRSLLVLVMVALFLLMAPGAFAETKHAAENGGITSVSDNVKAEISFVNQSNHTIKVYWLNYEGKRVLYKTLKSQEDYIQETFLTHPWLITDESDNAWYLYYADGQPRIVEIMEPAQN